MYSGNWSAVFCCPVPRGKWFDEELPRAAIHGQPRHEMPHGSAEHEHVDVVRHRLVQEIIEAYDRYEKKNPEEPDKKTFVKKPVRRH